MPLNLEEAIKKYSGGDDAYALKLKEGIRDAMGYSNYMAKLKGAVNTDVDPGNVEGMDPGTIARNRAAKAGINQDNVNHYSGIVDTIDSASSSLAERQAAEAKAGKSKGGLENGVAFKPEDELDQMILAYQQNPKNPDGSIKSLQQFEAEVNAYFGKDMFGPDMDKGVMRANVSATGEIIGPKYTKEQINERIATRVPKDFIGNEDKYSLMSQGYSEKQAKEFAGALNYDTMSAPEKLIYQVQHPEMAKKLETGQVSKQLLSDLGTVTDPKTGQTTPKYTFDELKERYPNVAEADIKAMILPTEKKAIQDDVSQWLDDKKEGVLEMIADPDLGYSGFMADDKYKELKTKLSMEYGGVFTDREIDQLIYNTIRSAQ